MTANRKLLSSMGDVRLGLRAAISVSCLMLLSACGQPAASGDPAQGQGKSAICAQCHGKNGISIVPIYPNLAGQKEQYLVLSLQAYRSGERVNMAMTPHARNLSDQDIADLAAFYARMDPGGGGSPPAAK